MSELEIELRVDCKKFPFCSLVKEGLCDSKCSLYVKSETEGKNKKKE